MAKIRKAILGVLVSMLIISACFLIFKNFFAGAEEEIKIGTQEQIKIFPSSYSGDWQNPEAVFFQDLGENAPLEEFNTENSAYLFKITEEKPTLPTEESPLEKPPEELPEEPVKEHLEQPEEPQSTSFWNKVKNFLWGTTASAQEENQQQAPSEEELPKTEPPKEELPTEELPKEEKSVSLPIEKTLELSNFSISDELQEKEIKNVQLRLSLAGRGESNNSRLLIEYQAQDSWQGLGEIALDHEFSNATNGGYWLYALPISESWQDFNNFKIRFKYFSQLEGNSGQPAVYLDAAWLEVDYEEIEEEIFIAPIVEKKDFRSNEDPEFDLEKIDKGLWGKIVSYFYKNETTATIVDPMGTESSEGIVIENNKIRVSKPDKRIFIPGVYKLKIKIIESGEEFIEEKEFGWGVLAVNTNKSIYLPGETAYLQMAALNNYGHTLCDANLILEIKTPGGSLSYPEIQKSGDCAIDNVTDKPDYFAYYLAGEKGIYLMKLTNLDNNYEIIDYFRVRDSVSFDIERIGPTRIYPPAAYDMKIIIKVNKDFNGEVIEEVAESFEIAAPEAKEIRMQNNVKEIVWQVDWKAGDNLELKYSFDAPNISPYLYLLGPLKIDKFQETRQWQIAADATYTASGSGDWNTNANWGGGGHPVAGDIANIGNFAMTVAASNAAATTVNFTASGATITVTSPYTLTISGTLTLNNLATASTTGTLAGTGAISIGAIAVGNHTNPTTTSTTYTHTLALTGTNAITCSGDLTINSEVGSGTGRRGNGVLSLQTANLTVSGSVVTYNENAVNNSTFTMATGGQSGTLNLGGATPWNITATGTSTITLNGTSATVNYTKSDGGQNPVRGTAYTTLNIQNTSGTDTVGVANTTATTLNTTAGGTLNMVTYTLGVTNVTNNGIIQTQNTSAAPITTGKTWGGTVQYDATTGAQTVMAGTYGILTLSNTSGTDAASAAITATTLNISNAGSTLNMVTFTLGVTTINNSGTIRTQCVTNPPITAGLTWGGTVQYDSTAAAQSVAGGTYNNLTFANTGRIATLVGNVTVSTALTITSGTFQLSTFNLQVDGTTSVTGVLSDTNTSGTNLFVQGVTVNNTGTWTTTNNPAFEFRGGLTINTASTFTQGTGTYTFSTNSQTISGTQAFTITNLSNTIIAGNGLIFSTNNPTVTTLTQAVDSILTFSGTVPTITTLTATNSGNTVKYTKSDGGQTVKGTTYVNLTLSNTSGIQTAGGSLVVNGTLITTASGILDMANAAYTLTGTLGTITNNGTIKTPCTTNPPIAADKTWGGTVQYSATTGAQTVVAGTYNNLTLSNTSGTQTAGGDITVSNVLTTTASGIFDASSRTITLSGTTGTPFVNGGTFTHSTSTVQYTGANAGGNTNVVGSVDYFNLILNAADTFDAAGNIEVSNVFTITSGTFDAKATTITLSGTTGTPFVNSGTFTHTTSIVQYTGANAGGNTNVVAVDYYDLKLNAADTFDAAGNIEVSDVFTIQHASAIFDAKATTLTLSGSGTPFVKTGTFTPSTSIVKYTAAAATNVTDTTYNNLELAPGAAGGGGTPSWGYACSEGTARCASYGCTDSSECNPTYCDSSTCISLDHATITSINCLTQSTANTCSCCFSGDTLIKMGDGSYKKINDIEKGDLVLAFDEEKKVVVKDIVADTWSHTPREMGEYFLIINNKIKVTPGHPLYTTIGVLPAGNLKEGDKLIDEKLNSIIVYSIEKVYKEIPTYNIHVKEHQNFFASGILAHNKLEPDVCNMSGIPSCTGSSGTCDYECDIDYYNCDSDNSNGCETMTPCGGGTPVYTLGTSTSQTINIDGYLTIGDGTNAVTVNATTYDPTLNVDNDLTISASAEFIASNSASSTIAGDFTNSGTFTHSSGTITFDGAGTSELTYSAATTFYNFTVETAGKQMKFDQTDQTNVAGLLYVRGTDCTTNRIFLDSMVADNQWDIDVTGSVNIDYADIEDSYAITHITSGVDNSTADNNGNHGWTISGGLCGGNQAPTVDVVSISPTPTIDLIADSTKTVTITATITDNDGCEDVFTSGSITAVFFDDAVKNDDCSQDDNDCYKSITLTEFNDTCTGVGDKTATASADVSVWFIANPSSSWTAKVTATDAASASGSNTSAVTINALAAFKVDTATIPYGSVDPENVSSQQGVLITATGNAAIDVRLSGINLVWSGNTILVGQQKSSANTGFDWDSAGTALTGDATCHELSLSKPTAHPSNQTENVYWKLKVPTGKPAGGPYSGTVTFEVVSDSSCP